MVVDLPQPLEPTNATVEPDSILKLKSLNICTSFLDGYENDTFLNSILVVKLLGISPWSDSESINGFLSIIWNIS